ncbi:hypothetical protein A5699_06940 [Mycobacterium sp. E802]|nr:hypothetical protein A5699_06940 [Mycobacterium sp. E802]
MIAAVIASFGAVAAFLGVTLTTRTTRKENRRAEKVAVLSDAWSAAVKYSRALEHANKLDDPAERIANITKMKAGPMWELSDEYVVATTKLPIYKFGVAYKALLKLHDELIEVWKALRLNPTGTVDEKRATELFKSAEQAITAAVDGLK